MKKIQPGISIKREVWRQFKNQVREREASKVVENFMEDYNINDSNQLRKYKQELKEKEKERDKLEEELKDVKSEIASIKATIENIDDDTKEKNKEYKRFFKVFKNKYKESSRPNGYDNDSGIWAKPEHISTYWSNELEMSKKELWNQGLSEM